MWKFHQYLYNKLYIYIYIYIYIVCVGRANSELLRWSRHFNDVSPFGLLQISVTGLKILGIKNCL